MIKLTRASGETFWVALHHIAMIDEGAPGSSVTFVSHHYEHVKETPAQILNAIDAKSQSDISVRTKNQKDPFNG